MKNQQLYIEPADVPTVVIRAQGVNRSEVRGATTYQITETKPTFVFQFPVRDAVSGEVAGESPQIGGFLEQFVKDGMPQADVDTFLAAFDTFCTHARRMLAMPKPALLIGETVEDADGVDVIVEQVIDDEVVVRRDGRRKIREIKDLKRKAKVPE